MLNNQSVIVNVNTEPSRPRKSILFAYILLFTLGGLGVHRYYLGRSGSGLLQLLLSILIIVTTSVLPFMALVLWLCVDLFLIPGMARQR